MNPAAWIMNKNEWRVTLWIPVPMVELITQLAEYEERDIPNEILVLLREALQLREGTLTRERGR